MLVTSGATNGEPKKHRAECVDPIDDVLHTELLFDNAGLVVNHVISIEARRDLLVDRRVRQQITSQLLNRKLVEGHVVVERADDPVTPRPHCPIVVREVAIRVSIASGVQPVDRHVFSVA